VNKTILSCLFIVAAMVQDHGPSGYYPLVLTGLVFCLGGDVCLALPHRRAFLVGLTSFLLGHVFYVIAFASFAQMDLRTLAGSAAVFVASGCVYLWLKPHLGPMNGPVVAYVLVISLMLCGAWSVAGNNHVSWSGSVAVLAGASAFYLSDLFVARDRFLGKAFVNRLIGLPLYYAGQFLLAFSVGMLG
jgi:uncharacterized membrane protein YhhN